MEKLNPWDEARQRTILRLDWRSGQLVPLDRGVNFFVETLERLGATTSYSCEGHPSGFYVVFDCPEETARRIRRCGFFSVEMGNCDSWVIRMPSGGKPRTERSKRQTLRWASAAWAETLNLGKAKK